MKKLIITWSLLAAALLASGQFRLSGIVTGESEPLTGASIVIVNTYHGTSTGRNGYFEFRNLKTGTHTLKISFIGYETREMAVELKGDLELKVNLNPIQLFTDEILVSATRAKDRTPVAYTNISNEAIASRNLGQDIPYLLSLSPSFVSTSDAGTGIGYTSFRIRGTDMNRINVTINGIPLNDSESHGTWFVDFPDLASSLDNVQIQRGVGTSTNGASAFGGSINLQSNTFRKEPYAEYKTAFGSYSTSKNTILAGTGLIDGKFTVDARLSKVASDGFIDRAAANLKSYALTAGFFSANTILKANLFSGSEETYQSWWGIPSVRLRSDLQGMNRYEDHGLYSPAQTRQMIMSNPRTYNYYTYENQVDRYQQDHFHLHFSQKITRRLTLNSSAFYIKGNGYYENFEPDEDFADYRMPYPVAGGLIIETSDLINRKWLDNHFGGVVFGVNHNSPAGDLTAGGGLSIYDGLHEGRVIWARYSGATEFNHLWYSGTGLKKDANVYVRYNFNLTRKMNLYADAQYRFIDYSLDGIDDGLRNITQNHRFNFFNPKIGVSYKPVSSQDIYASLAIGHREPNRSNYTDADPNQKLPVHETLRDLELGYNLHQSGFHAGINLYLMNYRDQLVLTGEINDVGAPVMENVEKSYRAGIELQSGVKVGKSVQWDFNLTLSRNKIRNFTEHVDNWDNWEQVSTKLGTTDLSFSPSLTGNNRISLKALKNLNITLISVYAGRQFIDNTSSGNRVLDPYFINNLETEYTFHPDFIKEIRVHFNIVNLFNESYETNAWVYSYIYNGERFKMDGYFPQAGINYMAGIDFRF